MRNKEFKCPNCGYEWNLCYRYIAPYISPEGKKVYPKFRDRCANCGYVFPIERK